jgi:hypothetical protein
MPEETFSTNQKGEDGAVTLCAKHIGNVIYQSWSLIIAPPVFFKIGNNSSPDL